MDDSSTIIQQMEADFRATVDSMAARHKAEVDGLTARLNDALAQLAWCKRQLFGRKSEKRKDYDHDMPNLFADQFEELARQAEEKRDEAVAKVEEEKKEDRRRKRRNRIMMENLPVMKRTVLEPDGVDLSLYKKIGEEVTRVVEHEPGKLYIHEIVRPKYGLKDNTHLPPEGQKSVEIAGMPFLPIDKGIAGASLLTEVLLQKYEYHVPFYRQIKQFAHLGMKGLKENTVDGWFKKAMELLRPLYKTLEAEVFKSDYVQADETTTPVIDREKEKAAKEYLWMVRSVMERLVLFHYDNGSRAGAVIGALADRHKFKGILQCDGFAGYETAFKTNAGVTLVNCMVHIRRYFERALDENKDVAQHALTEIRHLYRIEHICDETGLDAEARKAKRNELARPIMNAMKVWMETEGIKYSESSLTGKAVTYAYTHWNNMTHYLDDGRILLDNNLAENEIRPITIGRKNYLFCGNHEAAGNMAVVCSLLATCRNHDVNPRIYLTDVLGKMPYLQDKDASHEKLVELLPLKWKLHHPEAVMTRLRDEV